MCVDADAPHVVVLGALSSSANALPALMPTLGNDRCWGNIACGFASGCLPTASPFKAMDRRTALPDSRMSTFLQFLSAAADFALSEFPIWRV